MVPRVPKNSTLRPRHAYFVYYDNINGRGGAEIARQENDGQMCMQSTVAQCGDVKWRCQVMILETEMSLTVV